MIQLRGALYGSVITILTLVGGLLIGLVSGSLIFDFLSGHNFTDHDPVHILVAALPALTGFLGGSALWGLFMGRLAGTRATKSVMLAGMLGFAPTAMGITLVLQVLEPIAVEKLGAQFPIHRLFTFFFVPSAFLIAGISAFALGVSLRNQQLARNLFWRVGVSAAVAFLAVNLAMEANGWIVGAPGAGERATMLTVMFAGNFGAAVVGGGILGLILTRQNSERRENAGPIPAQA